MITTIPLIETIPMLECKSPDTELKKSRTVTVTALPRDEVESPVLPEISGAHQSDDEVTLQGDDKRVPIFLLIGVGPFARRSYLPRLKTHEASGRAVLAAAIDLEGNRVDLEKYRQSTCPTTEFIYLAPFTAEMPDTVASELTSLVHRLRISCVIVSTEPLAHVAYAQWALGLGLHIVMDKPVSTREWVVSDVDEAKGIADDFSTLVTAYKELQKQKSTLFLVNSHRRYHAGFQEATQKIRDVQEITGCPVTSIYTAHCDGQWRLPTEILDLNYHGYNKGYGKVSHSGYHGIDMVYQFLRAGIGKKKQPDRVDIVSNFVQPHGAFFQLDEEDHKKLFGEKAYSEACRYTAEELYEKTRDFGEIDASIQLAFYYDNAVVALAHLDLMHTGFGCRSWIQPSTDLYKGNGRARQEMHEIKSGPLQAVIIDSRQASDKHDIIRPDHSDLGGNGHFDLKVFRNAELLGEKNVMSVTKLQDMVESKGQDYHGYSKSIKYAALDEAMEYMEGNKEAKDLISSLPDHEIPAHLMSGIYLSHGRRRLGLDPTVSLDLTFENGSGRASFSFDPRGHR
ncbi:hypothetical protein CC80DRAFT_448864 [Byssothecium circinans]|uniref:Gfo/Idh/MocA-like oxidoreductase N-terminal domain-containing protein n=1 Tax=Byssothecium circinans TaxID=147558 RepID=A0A6A5TRL3_9PLEO|nr:hypothetical protein CC80DRAFT_448864 [Byssothecium circinans]